MPGGTDSQVHGIVTMPDLAHTPASLRIMYNMSMSADVALTDARSSLGEPPS
jgi:hypothetical protein